jgi:hypothetical protein
LKRLIFPALKAGKRLRLAALIWIVNMSCPGLAIDAAMVRIFALAPQNADLNPKQR